MRYTKEETQEAREYLLKVLKPGDTIYTVLKSVSRSGMMRRIDLYVIKDGEPVYVTKCAQVLDGQKRSDDGLRMQGCGMDMGFAAVYNLGRDLFPNGFDCPGYEGKDRKERCPSSDHVNRVKPPEGTCLDLTEGVGACHNMECKPWHHTDGEYAFHQHWM